MIVGLRSGTPRSSQHITRDDADADFVYELLIFCPFGSRTSRCLKRHHACRLQCADPKLRDSLFGVIAWPYQPPLSRTTAPRVAGLRLLGCTDTVLSPLQEEDYVYRILDRLFTSLPRRQQHLVNEATLKGGANGISYLDSADQCIATSADGAVTVYLSRPGAAAVTLRRPGPRHMLLLATGAHENADHARRFVMHTESADSLHGIGAVRPAAACECCCERIEEARMATHARQDVSGA